MTRIPATRILPDADTERLELRRWTATDADGLAAVNADPEVARFVNDGAPITATESRLASDRIVAHWTDYGFGLWSARCRGGDGRLLGFVGVCHALWFPALAHTVEVGWRLRRAARGHGYATEGAQAALEHAFAAMPLREIVAFIHPENVRSRAVAERIGMRFDRTVAHPSRSHELDVYVIPRPM
jgi:RimJ/RimL family protein N-acetyltransferase